VRRMAIAWTVLVMLASGCDQAPAPAVAPTNGDTPKAMSNPAVASERYNLARDEARGGHTLEKHVGRADDQLRERLRRERISAASTWTDRESAETTVAEALRAERRRIDSWTRRGYPRANLALHYEAGRPIGRSLRRGDQQPVDCTGAVIVLRADGPESFYVLTAYPEDHE
jgi:Bacterial CdiA-CT RNAse A domain